MDLKNKRIIITGASSGIGLDLLKRLKPYNAKIIAVARTIDKIEAGIKDKPWKAVGIAVLAGIAIDRLLRD